MLSLLLRRRLWRGSSDRASSPWVSEVEPLSVEASAIEDKPCSLPGKGLLEDTTSVAVEVTVVVEGSSFLPL